MCTIEHLYNLYTAAMTPPIYVQVNGSSVTKDQSNVIDINASSSNRESISSRSSSPSATSAELLETMSLACKPYNPYKPHKREIGRGK